MTKIDYDFYLNLIHKYGWEIYKMSNNKVVFKRHKRYDNFTLREERTEIHFGFVSCGYTLDTEIRSYIYNTRGSISLTGNETFAFVMIGRGCQDKDCYVKWKRRLRGNE